MPKPGSDIDNTGGFIGMSYDLPGVHWWLAGTIETYVNLG